MKTFTTTFVGCDIGDRTSELCHLNTDAKVVKTERIASTRDAFRKYFEKKKCKSWRVVIEAGGHSPWISTLFKNLGVELIIANPRNIKLISHNKAKSDRADAELLARLGRSDPKLLAPVQHRNEAAQRDLTVIRVRAGLVECRTKLINQARGLVKSAGHRLPTGGSAAFARKAKLLLPTELADILKPLLDTIESLTERIEKLNTAIEQDMVAKCPVADKLQTIDGVGALTALTFVLTLEDPQRFPRSRTAGAYLGLRPRRAQSGERDPEMHITKAGDTYLRRLLVGCAQRILGPFGKESELRTWGLKLAARGKKAAKKRAIVAVARKLAVLMLSMWKTGTEYQPMGYQQLRAVS